MISLDTPEPEQLSTADNALIIAALLSFPVTIAFLLAAREQWIRVLQPQVLVALPSLGLNIAAVLRLLTIPTDTTADRAQMGPSPILIPGLLTILVILAIVLNELVLHIVPARGPLGEYAPDPTPQLALLAVAVATVALMKLVGWYRRRGSADQ